MNENSQLSDLFDGFEATYSQEELQADWQGLSDKIGVDGSGTQGDAGSSASSGASGGGFMASGLAKIVGVAAGIASIGTLMFLAWPSSSQEDVLATNEPSVQQVDNLAEANNQNNLADASRQVVEQNDFTQNTNSETKEEVLSKEVSSETTPSTSNRSSVVPAEITSGSSAVVSTHDETASRASNDEQGLEDGKDPLVEVKQPAIASIQKSVFCASSPVHIRLEHADPEAVYTWGLLNKKQETVYGGSIRNNVTKVIDKAGVYQLVVIELDSDNEPTEILRERVKVVAQPKVLEIEATQNPCDAFELKGVAENATQYGWQVNGKTYAKKDMEIAFDNLGEYPVHFIAKNGKCADTLTDLVGYYNSNKLSKPELSNVLTPNGDSRNDVFDIFKKNPDLQYKNPILTIADRNGNVMFKSSQDAMAWNGNRMNVGDQCPSGNYFYVLTYDSPCADNQRERIAGSIYLNR